MGIPQHTEGLFQNSRTVWAIDLLTVCPLIQEISGMMWAINLLTACPLT